MTKEFTDTLREIFIKGKTEMSCVWLMLIMGLVFGYFIRGGC